MAKKIKKVKMSVPEGYDMNTTYHPLYYDFERNTDSNRDSFSDKLDIENKLARISNKGINDQTEDTVDDLIGYLLLLKMSLE